VWHKEILWAMSQGIHVFGGASMGALRAAELAAFGMEGVGSIFESFRSGELEDDDEVAVAHGQAEDGYRVLSEPMVNIRATLQAAEAEGLLGPRTRAALERMAKELFYFDRVWRLVLSRGAREGLPTDELAALEAWLPQGRVDQKRRDALAMLKAMRARLAEEPGPKRVRYHFEHTDAWEWACQQAGQLPPGTGGGGEPELPGPLLDELRLTGTLAGARLGALARVLASEEGRKLGRHVGQEELAHVERAFRLERGLWSARDFEWWRAEQRLDEDALRRLLHDEAHVRWLEVVMRQQVTRHLPEHLRSTGEYGRLLERASAKQRVLGEHGMESPRLSETGMTEEQLWRWYFEENLGHPVPDDLKAYALATGFEHLDALRRAVLREWCFQDKGRGS
jgi:hypothetical protein